jgi:hypothetical protein
MDYRRVLMDSIDNAVVKRQLPCQLTHMETADAAMLAATRQGEYDKVEEEKKRVLGRYTARLKSLRAEMSIESKKATTGVEERSVECVWCVDRERCKAVLRRTDTQEIVQERELTKSDIQLTMTELMQFLEENAESPAALETEAGTDESEDGKTVGLFKWAPEELEEAERSPTPTEDAVNDFLKDEPDNVGPGEKWLDCPECKGLMKRTPTGGYACACSHYIEPEAAAV